MRVKNFVSSRANQSCSHTHQPPHTNTILNQRRFAAFENQWVLHQGYTRHCRGHDWPCRPKGVADLPVRRPVHWTGPTCQVGPPRRATEHAPLGPRGGDRTCTYRRGSVLPKMRPRLDWELLILAFAPIGIRPKRWRLRLFHLELCVRLVHWHCHMRRLLAHFLYHYRMQGAMCCAKKTSRKYPTTKLATRNFGK